MTRKSFCILIEKFTNIKCFGDSIPTMFFFLKIVNSLGTTWKWKIDIRKLEILTFISFHSLNISIGWLWMRFYILFRITIESLSIHITIQWVTAFTFNIGRHEMLHSFLQGNFTGSIFCSFSKLTSNKLWSHFWIGR